MAAPSPNYEPRTLILCFDGTGNSFNDENTNVVRLFSVLDKKRTDKQLCYYQPGIGTYVAPTAAIWSPLTQRIAKLADEGFAWYLETHILGGYRFLMENYTKGDRICLFGFSRGAYTARCLAGMLHKVGLLPKSNEEQVAFAFKKYKDSTDHGRKLAKEFKAAFSRVVEIEFIGVWDTVSSVGILGKNLPFTASNTIVKTFRHALALDEHRALFKPNPWHHPAKTKEDAKGDPNAGTAVHSAAKKKHTPLEHIQHIGEAIEDEFDKFVGRSTPIRVPTDLAVDLDAMDDEGEEDDYRGRKPTDVREVWFAGCHADVGGGSVRNNTTNSLANPSLMWMINQVIKTKPGVIFVPEAFKYIPAFETLTITLSDATPRHRGGIPNTFLRARKGQEVSEATVTDQILPPTPPSTAGLTVVSSSSKKTTFGDGSTISESPTVTTKAPSLPPTPSTAGPTQTITITSHEQTRTMTLSEAPSTLNKIPPGPKAQFSISSDAGETVVSVFQDAPETDAQAEKYDQLEEKKGWWVLEYIPLVHYWQNDKGKWYKQFYRNKGRPRTIESTEPLFHASVQMRRKLKPDYEPLAKTVPGAVITYVDDADVILADEAHHAHELEH